MLLLIHRALTLPRTQTPSRGMRVRTGREVRLTRKMQQRETNGSTLGIGKPSWRRPRDWPMMTHSQTPMLQSWGRMACKGLHYPCMTRLPTPHLTPQGVWACICRGHQWTTCHNWRQQLPVQTLLRCMSMRQSWTTSEPEAHGRASYCCGRYVPKYIAQFVHYKAHGNCNSR